MVNLVKCKTLHYAEKHATYEGDDTDTSFASMGVDLKKTVLHDQSHYIISVCLFSFLSSHPLYPSIYLSNLSINHQSSLYAQMIVLLFKTNYTGHNECTL